MQLISDTDKLRSLEREVAMRKAVYPKWVASGRMKQEAADREIATMDAIAQEYRDKVRPRTAQPIPADLLDRLKDLLHQATVDRSHTYTGHVIKDAIAEIERLRGYEWMYRDLCE